MIIDLLAYILFFHHEQIAIPFIATTIITLFLGDGQGYHLITQNGPSFTSSEITFRNTFWNKKFWMTVLIAMTAMMNRVIWTVCLAAVMNRDEPNNISQGEEKALGLGEL
ncbi:uncharacterized protein L201_005622 [Kwoniella dendrophila CBS 6074]|uniref:Uncharacterized protein n=1 Tax=Kwoniella dendrophila CBS 6074 TaxID=1295534 RepID=A0AAX4JZ67_9TREE